MSNALLLPRLGCLPPQLLSIQFILVSDADVSNLISHAAPMGWEIAANYNVTTLFMADALHGLSLGDTYKQSVLYLVSLMLRTCMIAPTIIEGEDQRLNFVLDRECCCCC